MSIHFFFVFLLECVFYHSPVFIPVLLSVFTTSKLCLFCLLLLSAVLFLCELLIANCVDPWSPAVNATIGCKACEWEKRLNIHFHLESFDRGLG